MPENDKVQILLLAPEEVEENHNLTAGAKFRLMRMAAALVARRIVPQFVAYPPRFNSPAINTKAYLFSEMEALLGGRAIMTTEITSQLLHNAPDIHNVSEEILQSAAALAQKQTKKHLMPVDPLATLLEMAPEILSIRGAAIAAEMRSWLDDPMLKAARIWLVIAERGVSLEPAIAAFTGTALQLIGYSMPGDLHEIVLSRNNPNAPLQYRNRAALVSQHTEGTAGL